MIIRRTLQPTLEKAAQQFPAVAVLGPRQSGKTTLAQQSFPDYTYFSFEDPDTRALVRADPRGFLNAYKDAKGVILDEIQHVPDLLSYMQTYIDKYKKIGHFIITGSHNLLLNESISQSLAGRIAILTLLPLSLQELQSAAVTPLEIDSVLFKGFYPGPNSTTMDPLLWYRSYLNTYIERDVRQIKNITSLADFQNFVKLCAGRVGQELNMTALSNDVGVSVPTISQWLSVLEASYIIILMQPYYKNFSKRLIKAPKLYFVDPGIVCSLLSITDTSQLFPHYLRGGLFESMIIADFYKQRFNQGLNPNCYFWRDQNGYEIDCIVEQPNLLRPIEIKVSQAYNTAALTHLTKWNEITETDPKNNVLIYGGDLDQPTQFGSIVSWRSIQGLV